MPSPAIALLPALLGPPEQADDPPSAQRVYRATRTVDTMVIDGKRTEETWKRAPVDDRFRERQPELGAVPPVRTTVQVAYDDFALYVFVDARSKPGEIRVRTLRRDNSGIFADDAIFVKIDPTHNRRNGYSLGVNADGAQIDSLGLDDGRQFITQWDGVWAAETVRRDDGFTAEFRIPFAILGIKSADERTIGFNISRDRPAENATYDWRLIVPPRSPMAASQFGDVVGLRNIRTQRAVEYTPFAVARTNFRPAFTVDPTRRPNLATGGDVRVQIGAGSYIEASLLTDFAQVEADEVQVARDRFPLFFPERRPFFLNGLDVFQFGRDREAQLFFSRRVGLVDGTPVPILGGAKVYGRSGPISYGVLQVQTLGAPDDPERALVASQPENITVGRIRVQTTRIFNVGMLALGQHRFGAPDTDHAGGGVDAQVISRDGRVQWYSFLAGTYNQRPATPTEFDEFTGGVVEPARGSTTDVGASGHSFVEYRGLFVRPQLLWLWTDRDFDPALGFYRRTGAAKQEARLDFAPRPRILGLREIVFGPRYTIETTPEYDKRLLQSGGGRVEFKWRNGSEVEYGVFNFIDQVQNPFELYLYKIEAKRYSGFRHRFELESPSRQAIRAEGSYEIVNLFGGRTHQPSLGVTARLGKHFTFRGRYTHLVGHFEDRDERFNFGFANGNVDIAFTRNVAFDNLIRVDLSPGNERVGLQSRIRWRFRPGSDIFIVYRTDQPLGFDPVAEEPREPFHELTLKATFYFRALVQR